MFEQSQNVNIAGGRFSVTNVDTVSIAEKGA